MHKIPNVCLFSDLSVYSEKTKVDLFKSLSLALADFAALNPVAPLQMLFEVRYEIYCEQYMQTINLNYF